jgi:uncharacterized protein
MTTKDAIAALYRAFGSGDRAAIRAMLHDDAVWIAPAGNATQVAAGLGDGSDAGAPRGANDLDADEIARFMAEDFPRLFRDARNAMRMLIAEGDIGVIEHRLHATLPDGRAYVNDYCFVITVRDGLVAQIREYMDTRGGWRQVFGDGAGAAML